MLTIPNVTPVTLTRRRFIEELGLVGGTSLVMCAMTSWELMAGAAGQRPALSGRPAHGKVLVLGAGVSGLVIAYDAAPTTPRLAVSGRSATSTPACT
jgi:hypothetical protein